MNTYVILINLSKTYRFKVRSSIKKNKLSDQGEYSNTSGEEKIIMKTNEDTLS